MNRQSPCWYGVDVDNEGICDEIEKGVWEPFLSKLNSYSSACEAACTILAVDETVKNPKSEQVLDLCGTVIVQAQMEARGQLPMGTPGQMNPTSLKSMGRAMGGKVLKGRGGK